MGYLLIYLLTYLLTHSPPPSLTNSLTHSLTHLPTYLLTHLDTYLLIYLLTYLHAYFHTYSMKQSPSWEVNWFWASQEIPRILWNLKVYCRIRKCPPPVPILSHLDQVRARTSHFLKIHLNIILPPTTGSSKWPLSLRCPQQNPVYTSRLSHSATCPAHLIFLDFITRTIFREAYTSLSSSICSFLHSPVTSSLFFLIGLPQQAEVAQGVPGRLRPRIFLTFGTTRVAGRQPYAPATLTPRENP